MVGRRGERIKLTDKLSIWPLIYWQLNHESLLHDAKPMLADHHTLGSLRIVGRRRGRKKLTYSCLTIKSFLLLIGLQSSVVKFFFFFPFLSPSSHHPSLRWSENSGLCPMACGPPSAWSWSRGRMLIFPLSPLPPSSLPLFSPLPSFSKLVVSVLRRLAQVLWLNCHWSAADCGDRLLIFFSPLPSHHS